MLTSPLSPQPNRPIHQHQHSLPRTQNYSQAQLVDLLTTQDKNVIKDLYKNANSITEFVTGNKVFFRGLIEFSNVCEKNCHYCGIRKDMQPLRRYTMPREEIIECALWAHQEKYGTVMLQSGEITNNTRVQWLVNIIKEIREKTNDELAVALSIGELHKDEYIRLKEAGAIRYLLRIESSNPDLYSKMHPNDEKHSWEARVKCIETLRDIGFQVGTGVMIGLPDQTSNDLARDIQFFKDMNVDMIGMGPYIVQRDTPLGKKWFEQHPTDSDQKRYHEHLFELTCRMIALTRVTTGTLNLAATTALQAMNPIGREIALTRGANIVMPILTPVKYREDYQLYEGKPCLHEGATECQGCISNRIKSVKKEVGWGDPGNPVHWIERLQGR